MNFTQLDTFFNNVFAGQSKAPKNYGTQHVGSDITLVGGYSNGVYTLTCKVSGVGITTIRSKSAGTNAPVETPWNMDAINAYYLAKMDAIYNALPVDTQARFATEYVAVKDFVKRGKSDVAKQLVSSTAVPDNLTATKNQLLALP